jgi:3-deoxy-D-manno-octulosonic-acid transferase
MLLIYRILIILAIVVSFPYLLIKAIWGKHGIGERLGFIPKRQSSGRLFWFHAASVGELKVLATVIPEIKKLIPDLEIAVSTTTATGKCRAMELFGYSAIVIYQPLEITSAILRSIENLKPEKLISVETEIWPLWLSVAAEMGIELNLINACLSTKSFRLYKMIRPFTRSVMGKFNYILAQTQIDADRFKYLGGKNVEVIGNTKFDQALILSNSTKSALSCQNNNYMTFVGGSIRKGEDKIIADMISKSLQKKLPIFYILVPRHMKDLDNLCGNLKTRNINFKLWSDFSKNGVDPKSVLVVNSMGELTSFYKSADIAFVGGSLVPIGGHDPAEPAALGKSVLFGPYMENAQDAALLLTKSGGADVVHDGDELLKNLEDALKNSELLAEKGRRAKKAVLSRSGVSAQIARIIAGDER